MTTTTVRFILIPLWCHSTGGYPLPYAPRNNTHSLCCRKGERPSILRWQIPARRSESGYANFDSKRASPRRNSRRRPTSTGPMSEELREESEIRGW